MLPKTKIGDKKMSADSSARALRSPYLFPSHPREGGERFFTEKERSMLLQLKDDWPTKQYFQWFEICSLPSKT